MNQAACLFRLAAMRRHAGAKWSRAFIWAAGLLWRNHQAGKQRQHIERRVEVERAARQRL